MNIAFSVAVSMLNAFYLFASAPDDAPFPFLKIFLQSAIKIFITVGLALSIGYHEFYKKKQYSFYHNHAITRVKLFMSALLINSIIGTLLLTIVSYA